MILIFNVLGNLKKKKDKPNISSGIGPKKKKSVTKSEGETDYSSLNERQYVDLRHGTSLRAFQGSFG